LVVAKTLTHCPAGRVGDMPAPMVTVSGTSSRPANCSGQGREEGLGLAMAP
jgi:hypothetical protein